MNTFKKLSVGIVFGFIGLTAAAAPVRAADVLGVSVNVAGVAAEITQRIATELASHLRQALQAPRTQKVRQPSVIVTEGETVTVTAARLPAYGAEDALVRTAQTSSATSVRF